jgi:hypothetical protein
MNQANSDSMAHFLAASDFCDVASPEVQRLAASIKRRVANGGACELAALAFYEVQNSVEYRVGVFQHTASQTLRCGFGSCSNKSNALCAVLRALGICSGMAVMRVNGTSYFCWPRPGFEFFNFTKNLPLLSRFSRNSPHFFALVYLEGRWLLADPTDDLQLSFGGQHCLHCLQPVTFDGKSDAMLHINPEDVIEHWDLGKQPLQNLDNYLRKKNRASAMSVQMLNLAIKYIRVHGPDVKHLSPIQQFAGCMKFILVSLLLSSLLDAMKFMCGLRDSSVGDSVRAAQMDENDIMPIESDAVKRNIAIGGACSGTGRCDRESNSRSATGGISFYKLKCQRRWAGYSANIERYIYTHAKQVSVHPGDELRLEKNNNEKKDSSSDGSADEAMPDDEDNISTAAPTTAGEDLGFDDELGEPPTEE